MKGKTTIGPWKGGITDRGGVTDGESLTDNVVGIAVTANNKHIITFEISFGDEISEVDVSTYDELKEFAVEDFFALKGKEFQFRHGVDGKKTVINNDRNFKKFVEKHAGKGEVHMLTIITVDEIMKKLDTED